MRKWLNPLLIVLGLIIGAWMGKYHRLQYENAKLTNWILQQEIRDYKEAIYD